jgi:LacI family transcriptional regulator
LIYASGSTGRASPELAALFEGFPVVALDDELSGLVPTSVVSDNLLGGRLVANHLTELGHRRALILGANPHLTSIAARVEGFVDTWRALGLPEPTLVAGALTEEAGYALAHAHAGEGSAERPTAIFALNDLIAMGVLRALREQQIAVPERCSVVGFDDISPAKNSWPPLTTIRQDTTAMGELAVQSLVNRMSGDQEQENVTIPVELIVRESSGEVRE